MAIIAGRNIELRTMDSRTRWGGKRKETTIARTRFGSERTPRDGTV